MDLMAGAGGIFGGLAVGLAGGMGGGGAEGGAMTGINGIMSAAAKFGRSESQSVKPTIDSLPDKVRIPRTFPIASCLMNNVP